MSKRIRAFAQSAALFGADQDPDWVVGNDFIRRPTIVQSRANKEPVWTINITRNRRQRRRKPRRRYAE
jgi:hypothetical protein